MLASQMQTPLTPASLLTMSPAQTYESSGGDSVGPHPSYIQLARLYISEPKLQESLKATGVLESKEDTIRLVGVAWIDSVRKALKLPVRTFDTAVMYFHKFRLAHCESEYGVIDAVAAAALFTACKVEDTQKRSRDILCAAHNLKLPPSEHLPADDPRFEAQSKTVLGLERLMLESSCFDFRSQSPQKVVIKLVKSYNVNKATVGKTAYNMSLDLYRTFAPMKQTTQTLAIACVELAGRLHGEPLEGLEEGRGYRRYRTSRVEVMETLQDLLDLYIHHRASTLVGAAYTVESFIALRIPLNQEAQREGLPRHLEPYTPKPDEANGNKATNGAGKRRGPLSARPSPTSPAESSSRNGTDASPATPRQQEREAKAQGTVRFMLDGDRMQEEKATVEKYFKVEEEEYEVEIEVMVNQAKDKDYDRDRERGYDRAREPKDPRERDRERGFERRDRERDWDTRRRY